MSDRISGGLGSGSTTKPQNHLRTHKKVTDLIHDGTGYLTDLSGNHEVELNWELNKQAVKDQVFTLRIDDKQVYLDLDELLYHTRIMFMKGD